MKRFIFLLILFTLLGGFLGQLILTDKGYIMLAFDKWVIETSVWIGLIALIILFGILYAIVYGIHLVFSTDLQLKDWTVRRKQNRARRFTTRGLLSMAQGQWGRAEKQLVLGAEHSETKLINFLAAARASHEQGDGERTDELLQQAAETTKGAELAVGITQAQLQLDRKQEEQALATILRLRKQYPSHKYLVKMLMKIYVALKDWQAITDILPLIRKKNVLKGFELAQLERQAFGALLDEAAAAKPPRDPLKAVTKVWSRVPNHLIKDEYMLAAYIKILVTLKDEVQAESLLRIMLKNYWVDELVRLYGMVKGSDPKKQLLYAEDKIQQRPNDPTLFLTLGRLSMQVKQWAKALEYFEASASLQKSDEVYSELCRLYAAMGDHSKAMHYFKQGVMNELPSLPLPVA